MTTSAERADSIVQRLNEGPQAGYNQAITEIRDAQRDNPNFWRQHGQQVNDAVDFQRLGFNSDFQIMGLNSRNQLLTSDNNGTVQQVRSAGRLDVVSQSPQTAQGEPWGNNGRRFQADAEGRATYTIRQGDNLDHIARDVVAHNTGRTPTQQDILRARQEIARENNIRDVNNIRGGTTLRIPESLRNPTAGRPGELPPPPPEGTPQGADRTPLAQRGLRPEASRPAAEGGVYRSFSPPGVSADAGVLRSPSTYGEGERTNVQSRPTAGNRDVTSYDTQIGTYGFRRNANVADEVNRTTGVLERRSVNYPQADVSFYVATPGGGSQYLDNVRSVNVVRDAASGQYTSTYVLRDGRTFRADNHADGSPRYFNQVQQPGR